MNGSVTLRTLCACSALLAGAGLWATNTQLGLILPDVDCRTLIRWSALASFAAAALAVAAAILSWRWARRDRTKDSAFRFLGSMSGLAALVFAFALAMQGAASLVLSGCER